MTPPEVYDDAIEPELAAELEAVILARAEPGKPYPGGANRGGWKSGVDLFAWPEPPFQILRARIAAMLEAAGGFAPGNAWTVVNRNGSWHGRHRHGVPLMGILFITSGHPAVPTIFECNGGEIEIDPRPGRLVLCGDMFHRVPIYSGSAPRIVIAFDARIGKAMT